MLAFSAGTRLDFIQKSSRSASRHFYNGLLVVDGLHTLDSTTWTKVAVKSVDLGIWGADADASCSVAPAAMEKTACMVAFPCR